MIDVQVGDTRPAFTVRRIAKRRIAVRGSIKRQPPKVLLGKRYNLRAVRRPQRRVIVTLRALRHPDSPFHEQTLTLPAPDQFRTGVEGAIRWRNMGGIGAVAAQFLADPAAPGYWARIQWNSGNESLWLQTAAAGDGSDSMAGPQLSEAWALGWEMLFTAPSGETVEISRAAIGEDTAGNYDRAEPYRYRGAGSVAYPALAEGAAANAILNGLTVRAFNVAGVTVRIRAPRGA